MNEPPWMQAPDPITPERVFSCCVLTPFLIVVLWVPVVWFVVWLAGVAR